MIDLLSLFIVFLTTSNLLSSPYLPKVTYQLFIYYHTDLFCSKSFGEIDGVFAIHTDLTIGTAFPFSCGFS